MTRDGGFSVLMAVSEAASPWRVPSYAWPSALVSAACAAIAVAGTAPWTGEGSLAVFCVGLGISLTFGAMSVFFGRHQAACLHYGALVDRELKPLLDGVREEMAAGRPARERWNDYLTRRGLAVSTVDVWADAHATRMPFTPFAPVDLRGHIAFQGMGVVLFGAHARDGGGGRGRTGTGKAS